MKEFLKNIYHLNDSYFGDTEDNLCNCCDNCCTN